METVTGPDSMEESFEHMVRQYQLSLLRLCYAYLQEGLKHITQYISLHSQ